MVDAGSEVGDGVGEFVEGGGVGGDADGLEGGGVGGEFGLVADGGGEDDGVGDFEGEAGFDADAEGVLLEGDVVADVEFSRWVKTP